METTNTNSNDAYTLEEIREISNVERFIESVMVKIHTEEDANDIKDELLDHIYTMYFDYLDAGYNNEAAIKKSLLQMGDPSEIGYSFTDYDAMKRRRWTLVGLKWLAGIMLIVTVMVTSIVSNMNEEKRSGDVGNLAVEASTTQGNDNVGGETSIIKNVFETTMKAFEGMSNYLFLLIYIPMILFNVANGTMIRQGISLGKLNVNKDPLLILWSYKKRFPWEYALIGGLFSPILIIFVLLIIYEGAHPILPLSFCLAVGSSIWLYFFSERFRIPKYIVLEEGIVVKNRLITWAAMDRISWGVDYMSKGNDHHRLIIENVAVYRKQNISTKISIDVNGNQYHQVNTLLKEKLA